MVIVCRGGGREVLLVGKEVCRGILGGGGGGNADCGWREAGSMSMNTSGEARRSDGCRLGL
jgi:hypothetical protein